ncbi:MAG: phosphate signaling complex protein PhoU [Planctomycetota bacterium]
MPVHLKREIDKLKKHILSLCAIVEESVVRAVKALEERDEELAKIVVESDIEIDRREVELEEDVLKALALHQPVAFDLRLIVTVLKINNDLERIGDLAVNIAHKAIRLAAAASPDSPFDFSAMSEAAQAMLRDALDAFVRLDVALARRVLQRDEEVDGMKQEARKAIEDKLKDNPDRLPTCLTQLGVARNLERIADHATNIAEDVIYMVEGEIVRHRMEEFTPFTQANGERNDNRDS